jgi:hypothetical protein
VPRPHRLKKAHCKLERLRPTSEPFQHRNCEVATLPIEESVAGESQKAIPVRNKPLGTFCSSADPAKSYRATGRSGDHSTDTSPSCQIQLISGHESTSHWDAAEQAYQEAVQGVRRTLRVGWHPPVAFTIESYLVERNRNPKKYVWRASGLEILEKIRNSREQYVLRDHDGRDRAS